MGTTAEMVTTVAEALPLTDDELTARRTALESVVGHGMPANLREVCSDEARWLATIKFYADQEERRKAAFAEQMERAEREVQEGLLDWCKNAVGDEVTIDDDDLVEACAAILAANNEDESLHPEVDFTVTFNAELTVTVKAKTQDEAEMKVDFPHLEATVLIDGEIEECEVLECRTIEVERD
jgi:hypothetical protein